MDGEIQIIPDNNAAATGADHSAASTLWRAIMPNGTLVTPGTSGTPKWNATGTAGAGSPQLATAVTSQSDGTTSASQQYKDVTAAGGVTVPNLLKLLGMFPHDTAIERGRFYMRNEGERLPRRGGIWLDGSNEPPRLYRRAKLSENCPLWNMHKRRRPRSRIRLSSANVRCGSRWNTAMSIKATLRR